MRHCNRTPSRVSECSRSDEWLGRSTFDEWMVRSEPVVEVRGWLVASLEVKFISSLSYCCIPNGVGPFLAAVIVHGGGWVRGDRSVGVKPLFKPRSDGGFAWSSPTP